MSCYVKSRGSLWDSFLLVICCLIYLNGRGSLRTCPFIFSRRETHGWMDTCLLETTVSCHITGGVWASLPISAFRNSIICLFWDRYDWFPCRRHMWPFLHKQKKKKKKKGGYLSQQTGGSSCSLAQFPFLLCDTFWPAGHSKSCPWWGHR